METHVHRWRVEEAPTHGQYPAECQSCGQSRSFPAVTSAEEVNFRKHPSERPRVRRAK